MSHGVAWPALGLAAAILCLGCGGAAAEDPRPAAAVPPPAPGDSLTTLDTTALDALLESFSGRLVVLNFWATWCVPCVEEMPLLQEVAATYQERGVTTLGVSCDLILGGSPEEKQATVARFLGEHDITFRNVLFDGTEDELMDRFDLPGALPYTVILGRDGQTVWRHGEKLTPGDLDAVLDGLAGTSGR